MGLTPLSGPRNVSRCARDLAPLAICTVVGAAIGSGLLRLLPLYALQAGLPESAIGAYLAASYIALAVGAVLAGSLAVARTHGKLLLLPIGASRRGRCVAH